MDQSAYFPELDETGRQIDRRRKMAEAMMASGMGPMQAPTYMGGRQAPIHWLNGVAKILQATLGAKGMADADEESKGLASQKTQRIADEMMAVQNLARGTPEQPPMTPNDDEGNINPPVSATPGNPRAAIERAIMSQIPSLQQFGTMLHASEEGKLARQENAASREAQLKLAAAERKAAKEEADKRAFEQDERMARLTAGLRQPSAPVVTEIVKDGKLVKIDARDGRVIGEAAPKPANLKAQGLKEKAKQDLDLSIAELEKATADGGLIDQSTGSGAGALADQAAAFFGRATPGAKAAGQMAPIFDLVLKQVPRFEGPQSDKDTQSYKEAAGQLANPAVPNAQKKAAGKEILRLMKARKGQFINKDVEALEIESGGTSGGWKDL